jgi:hypothetical protein
MKLHLTIIAMFLTVFSFAQSTEPVSKLTYKEAVKIALQKNVNLNQQKNILESRQASRLRRQKHWTAA